MSDVQMHGRSFVKGKSDEKMRGNVGEVRVGYAREKGAGGRLVWMRCNDGCLSTAKGWMTEREQGGHPYMPRVHQSPWSYPSG
eukprot:CAMPEP_0184657190 /NCGR_PEP_ID=MMETSP0308-20130426/17510_1 /TAXON_ID=38269 /ORGANISM="Gloeochaete witrockiana, Strain SAG 46.84" /LENGTH=82 /DNA_ID=CAMNT_0027094695 /DNA_START=242 /DNA_END=487 /DNA_ORIENTATION=+